MQKETTIEGTLAYYNARANITTKRIPLGDFALGMFVIIAGSFFALLEGSGLFLLFVDKGIPVVSILLGIIMSICAAGGSFYFGIRMVRRRKLAEVSLR